MAVAGDTTPSIAAAIIGSSNLYASTSHVMSTSSGSRVRRLGTMAMSSNPYARRPDLPIPISTSTFPPEPRVRRYQARDPGTVEDIAARTRECRCPPMPRSPLSIGLSLRGACPTARPERRRRARRRARPGHATTRCRRARRIACFPPAHHAPIASRPVTTPSTSTPSSCSATWAPTPGRRAGAGDRGSRLAHHVELARVLHPRHLAPAAGVVPVAAELELGRVPPPLVCGVELFDVHVHLSPITAHGDHGLGRDESCEEIGQDTRRRPPDRLVGQLEEVHRHVALEPSQRSSW